MDLHHGLNMNWWNDMRNLIIIVFIIGINLPLDDLQISHLCVCITMRLLLLGIMHSLCSVCIRCKF